MISKQIMQELKQKYGLRTIYKKIDAIRESTGNSISKEVAADVLASKHVKVYDILKNEGRNQELTDFQNAMSKFDFDNHNVKRKSPKNNDLQKEDIEKSPYDYSLSKFDIDSELVADCKIQKPYRKAVSEAMLTLETRIRSTLSLPDTFTGAALITEAKKKGVFQRTVPAEEEGLYFLFMGSMKWLRNPSNHRKITYTKDDSIKMVLFADYLIKLFDDLVNKRI